MGVKNLWQLLYQYGRNESLPSKALHDGFLKNSNHLRSLVLGIDASIWFAQVENCKHTKRQNYQLELLYHRCAWLSEMAVKVIFVFDGQNRPMKRNRQLSVDEHYLIQSFCMMVHAFGFEFRVAPGEAEAELALLEQLGIIDAIMTDDSDAFLFGARKVIRNRSAIIEGSSVTNSNGKSDKEHVYTFDMNEFIQNEVAFTRGSFVLIGLLSGGDYSNGVHGVGVKTAVQVHQFGDSLFNIFSTLNGHELENRLIEWRSNLVAELTKDPYSKTMANLAGALPVTFPDRRVLEYYCRPLVSNIDAQVFKDSLWKRKLDIGSLAHIGEFYFGWDGPKKLFSHLHKNICRSLVLQRLIELAVLIDHGNTDQHSLRNDVLQLLSKICYTTQRVSMDYLTEYRVVAQFRTLVPDVITTLTRLRGQQSNQVLLHLRGESSALTQTNMAVLTKNIRIYLPAIIVDLALPQFVHSQKPIKKKVNPKKSKDFQEDDSSDLDLPSPAELLNEVMQGKVPSDVF